MDTIELNTTVLPGGRIELTDPRLREGETFRVTIKLLVREDRNAQPTISELLRRPLRPEDRCLHTSEEVDAYLEAERNSWE
jgi:hypothetical protein